MHDEVASLITAQLLFLEAEDPTAPISLYINSPGGVVTAGLAIYDTMQYVRAPAGRPRPFVVGARFGGVAPPLWPRAGDPEDTGRGTAAGATWIFRGESGAAAAATWTF